MGDTMIVDEKPTPGSPQAVERGCLCPPQEGRPSGIWTAYYVNRDCPLHFKGIPAACGDKECTAHPRAADKAGDR